MTALHDLHALVLRTACQVGASETSSSPASDPADLQLSSLGIDSLNLITFVCQLEINLNLAFDDAELSADAFRTVGSTASFVTRYRQDHPLK